MTRPSLTVRLVRAAVLTAACALPVLAVTARPAAPAAVTTVEAAENGAQNHCPQPPGLPRTKCDDTSWGG
ncbi:hypothetical protein ACFWXK_20780 [Streptomyces sp. NPDC059070]|uniref:hypothetical protein n=1 Tax=unclassified Streptomyces TaxID=2593676 RepID=UPI0034E23698